MKLPKKSCLYFMLLLIDELYSTNQQVKHTIIGPDVVAHTCNTSTQKT
jgi:hypothetical protein